MERLKEVLFMIAIGGLIALSPINLMLHELLHKLCLDKMGVKSKIIVKFLIVKWEGFKFSFIPIKDKSKIEAVTYPDLVEFNKCNKREKIIMYLLSTIVLTFIEIIILLSYLVIFKQTITSNFSIIMITSILCEILVGQQDILDTYKLCIKKEKNCI